MGVTVLGYFVIQHLCLCTSVCSPLVRKKFSCSSACFTQTWQKPCLSELLLAGIR